MEAPGLHTPSLRRRLTVLVLVGIALMLVALVVTTDRVVAARLDGQLHQRLVDRAGVADALVDQVDGRDLARRLEGEGVSVVVVESDGQVYAEGPLAGAAASALGGSAQASEPPATPGPQATGPGTPPGPVAPGPAGEATVQQSGSLLTVNRDLPGGTHLELLADAGDVQDTLQQVRLALGLAALLVLLASAVAVPLVVGRGLRPLGRITDVARSITRGDRQRRLRPSQPRSDLGRTAEAFDEMLDELVGAEDRARSSEARLRTFLSDAAHDLRTPITGVQSAAEMVLRENPERAEREQMLTTVVREARRAGRLVDDLLLMARIDQGLSLRRDSVDLRELVTTVLDSRRLGAPDVDLLLDVAAGPAAVLGDRDRLARALGNLLDNAVNAVREPATDPTRRRIVSVSMSGSGTTAWIDVCDSGGGVPPADRVRIFERMVRLDAARGRDGGGGSGLGLPIARGVARAHGGDVVYLDQASDAGPGSLDGACFRLTLPVATEAIARRDGAELNPVAD